MPQLVNGATMSLRAKLFFKMFGYVWFGFMRKNITQNVHCVQRVNERIIKQLMAIIIVWLQKFHKIAIREESMLRAWLTDQSAAILYSKAWAHTEGTLCVYEYIVVDSGQLISTFLGNNSRRTETRGDPVKRCTPIWLVHRQNDSLISVAQKCA